MERPKRGFRVLHHVLTPTIMAGPAGIEGRRSSMLIHVAVLLQHPNRLGNVGRASVLFRRQGDLMDQVSPTEFVPMSFVSSLIAVQVYLDIFLATSS